MKKPIELPRNDTERRLRLSRMDQKLLVEVCVGRIHLKPGEWMEIPSWVCDCVQIPKGVRIRKSGTAHDFRIVKI